MTHGKAVLLVDDHADARRIATLMLEELGYSVTACEGVAQGIAQLGTDSACDIVVTDLNMPGTSGFEFLTLVRRWRAKTPVVLMTGDEKALRSALDHGLIPLLKPFTVDQLRVALAEASQRRT